MELVVLPYTAVSFSIVARFIFMYLLYTKRSTNVYSLAFCFLSIISSSIWIPYGILVSDTPIIVRSGVEILLLSLSGVYIIRNRCAGPLSVKISPILPLYPWKCSEEQIRALLPGQPVEPCLLCRLLAILEHRDTTCRLALVLENRDAVSTSRCPWIS